MKRVVKRVYFLRVGFITALFTLCARAQQADMQSLLSSQGMHLDSVGPIKCGLPVMEFLAQARANVGPLTRARIDAMLQRPLLQKNIPAGRFRIHYDTVGVNTPSYRGVAGNADACAESVAAIANHVFEVETGDLGYAVPPSDNGAGGGNEYDIYIVQQVLNPGIAYGVTIPESPTGENPRTWTTFIKIHNDFQFVSPDSNMGLPALRVTLAHEFHHAIQVGRYGLWDNHIYFYEITSTWIEDVVYTNVNDYLQYLPAHFNRPAEPFTKFDIAGSIQYARCLWGHYVAKRFGRDVMRHAWENIVSDVPLQGMDNALAGVQSSFRLAFPEWVLWNYFTGSRADSIQYYPEGATYPTITQIPIDFSSSYKEYRDSIAVLSSGYFPVVLDATTMFTLITANVNFQDALAGSTRRFPFSISLSRSPLDGSFLSTPSGIYYKFFAQDQTNWYPPWLVVGSGVIPGEVRQAFPNPFAPDGSRELVIPIDIPLNTEGELSIFNSNFDLVYRKMQAVRLRQGYRSFGWNGLTNRGELGQSGIYFFAADALGTTYTGKFAVIRR